MIFSESDTDSVPEVRLTSVYRVHIVLITYHQHCNPLDISQVIIILNVVVEFVHISVSYPHQIITIRWFHSGHVIDVHILSISLIIPTEIAVLNDVSKTSSHSDKII